MFLPLIIGIFRRCSSFVPDTHECMNGDIFIGMEEETRKEIDDIGEENETENEDQHEFRSRIGET